MGFYPFHKSASDDDRAMFHARLRGATASDLHQNIFPDYNYHMLGKNCRSFTGYVCELLGVHKKAVRNLGNEWKKYKGQALLDDGAALVEPQMSGSVNPLSPAHDTQPFLARSPGGASSIGYGTTRPQRSSLGDGPTQEASAILVDRLSKVRPSKNNSGPEKGRPC